MPKDKLFFIHIPRTSGTSMVALLKKLYKGKKIGESMNLHEERTFDKRLFQGHDVNMAHVDFIDVQQNFNGYHYMTILRDPVERYLSNYFWQLKPKPYVLKDQEPCSLREFLDKDINNRYDNSMMWQLGDHFKVRERKADENTCYSRALNNLLEFKHILFYCNLADDVEEFIQSTGLPGKFKYPHSQGSDRQIQMDNLDPKYIEEIKERNSLDINLYKHAKELFND